MTYTKGSRNIGEEIYELAKSLKVVKHPLNPETGKENPQMWQVGNYDQIRGEEKFREWFTSNPKVWEEAMALCSRIDDEDEAIVNRNKALGYIDADVGIPEL
jgi:hypothetical protein